MPRLIAAIVLGGLAVVCKVASDGASTAPARAGLGVMMALAGAGAVVVFVSALRSNRQTG